eukprot:TRINITY_DN355_c1_g1_i1.p2 TRINITY_DN355_c1_g1~~TRINITY_DN355_c1_g1_i1.p2  ORF type:complete len:56 (+),score=2.78 TRINITY_DN355_c1_g1_i1:218-385(+)
MTSECLFSASFKTAIARIIFEASRDEFKFFKTKSLCFACKIFLLKSFKVVLRVNL